MNEELVVVGWKEEIAGANVGMVEELVVDGLKLAGIGALDPTNVGIVELASAGLEVGTNVPLIVGNGEDSLTLVDGA